jgi:methyl-accepting chemotaxis protein
MESPAHIDRNTQGEDERISASQKTTQDGQKNVEQFASSLAEMNATVKEVAAHAEKASAAANDAVSCAALGRDVARQMSSII